MHLNKWIKKYRSAGEETAFWEMKQLHDQKAITPVNIIKLLDCYIQYLRNTVKKYYMWKKRNIKNNETLEISVTFNKILKKDNIAMFVSSHFWWIANKFAVLVHKIKICRFSKIAISNNSYFLEKDNHTSCS